MSTQFEQIADYPTLTDSQRIQARDNARRNIVAKYAQKPERSDYDDYTAVEYPRWLTLTTGFLFAFVALAAGIISAFRLYYAGYNAFYLSIPNHTLAVIVGVLTPIAAETMVIVATVSSQIFLRSYSRLLALLPVVTGMAVAFVGNWEIADPSTTWGWVETLFPPVLVLSVALLFEVALMPEVKRRQENEKAYREARSDYDVLMTQPERHWAWRNVYGAALWEMWNKVYPHEEGGHFGRETKQLIALREMGNDAFFQDEITESFQKLQKPSPDTMVSQVDVMTYLRANPEAKDLKGKEIAEITGASPATVSRALRKFQKNGHEN